VLLLFSDQHHAGVLGCEGHPDALTPNLDRLAADGVRFNRAYCQDAVCGPSRASMMTGLYPRTLGVIDNGEKIAPGIDFVPLPTLMKQSGYYTACFGKQHLSPAIDVSWDTAYGTLPGETPSGYWEWIETRGLFTDFLNDWLAEFGDRLPGVGYNYSAPLLARLSRLPTDATMEAYVAEKTIDFLKSRKTGDKPFFCWSSFYRPHQPYTPIKKWADMYDPASIQLPGSIAQPPDDLPLFLRSWRNNEKRPVNLIEAARDETIYRRYITYYYALVTEIDYYIGQIIKTLEETGLDENTIVIYTSDHGEFVGNHGMVEKCHQGHSVYEDTLRVPLFIYWKGRTLIGKTASDLVELVDLYPTILDMCGLQAPKEVDWAGRSLASAVTSGKPVGRKYAICENYSQVSVITDRYKLGHWIEPPMADRDFRDFGDMLFDRQHDPLEVNNLLRGSACAEIYNELCGYLAEWESAVPADGMMLNIERMRSN